MNIPTKTVERLSTYRRILKIFLSEGKHRVYSHELAARVKVTPAQVRRDIMVIGYSGSPAQGYDVAGLRDYINGLLDPADEEAVVLTGVGHLGKALLAFFATRTKMPFFAAFDRDPAKTDRVIHGCRCHDIENIDKVLEGRRISVAIIAVPAASAQDAADRLIRAGARGILNFAPVKLRVPPGVIVEDVNITVLLEKVAFLARKEAAQKES